MKKDTDRKKRRRIRGEVDSLQNQMKQKHNGTWKLYSVLRALVIVFSVLAIIERRYEYFLICMLSLVLFLVPSFLEKKLKIEFPSTLEKIILLFIYAAEILGEMQAFYVKFPWWDTMLHTLNGFLCAAVGFALVDILNSNPRVKFELSPIYLAIAAFCFSMTVGVLWEFFEFSMDSFFHLDMQKDTIVSMISSVKLDPNGGNTPYVIKNITDTTINGQNLGIQGYLDIGLIDTMKDLIVNFVGAVVFCVIGYIYVATKGKSEIASKFIPTKQETNPEIEEKTI